MTALIDWDRPDFGGTVHESTTGSWTYAEGGEDQ